MDDFKVGDNVFHKSNSSIVWTIEKVENGEALCSTIIKDTYEQKKAVFVLTSIQKCASRSKIRVSKRSRDNYF
ncbi:hypothetical protein [Winogradskyella sp. 3972H.M.0a.05]|uniref:hypothetical protein n=1 Tax=Winogradskyella sp. 3972H.M.0a.05 TaxID=2950277 RepID=UPI00339920CE